MNRVAFLIDANGFVTDSIVVNSENEYVEGATVAVKPPIGISFYKMRWNGTEWVEGATQEEIDKLTKVEPSPPTAEERINALEEAILLMMMEG